MRRALKHAWVVVAALFALGANATSQGAAPSSPPPRGSAAIRASIRAVEARLDALLALARADARLELIRSYLAYTPEQFRDPHRPVTPDKLLEILLDPTASSEARDAAAAALGSDVAKRLDPDLSADGKGLRRPRALFSMKVVRSLDDADVTSRGLSERVLEQLWPQANEAAILQFNARKEKTWKPAIRAWQEHLKK